MFATIDRRRQAEQLSWAGLARDMWDESAALNAERDDHPISASTIRNVEHRGDSSCQHALIMLRWLGVSPESFVVEPFPETVVALPEADVAHRLRWNLRALYDSLDAARGARGATWEQTSQRLHCTANQLTGLRTAKYATSMRLAMRICQSLHRPAADFVHAAKW